MKSLSLSTKNLKVALQEAVSVMVLDIELFCGAFNILPLPLFIVTRSL